MFASSATDHLSAPQYRDYFFLELRLIEEYSIAPNHYHKFPRALIRLFFKLPSKVISGTRSCHFLHTGYPL